jgi:hypothetical protein
MQGLHQRLPLHVETGRRQLEAAFRPNVTSPSPQTSELLEMSIANVTNVLAFCGWRLFGAASDLHCTHLHPKVGPCNHE